MFFDRIDRLGIRIYGDHLMEYLHVPRNQIHAIIRVTMHFIYTNEN